VHPFAAMFAKPWAVEVVHGTLAAYVFAAFGAAAVCALALRRVRQGQVARLGLGIAMAVAAVALPLQVIAGDVIARFDADNEPVKFAAMEVVHHTERDAPLTVGGIPTPSGLRYTIEIPDMLSVLVGFNPHVEVRGLDTVPEADRPPIAATHLSFDTMIGSATVLVVVAIAWLFARRRTSGLPRWLVIAIVASGPLALVALEAGWFVTEFGRQPWIAVGIQRTTDAVTIAPNLDVAFYGFSVIYVVLGFTCAWLLRRIGAKA
jgi:cytochrome d ubiquinol oxidase subunit I